MTVDPDPITPDMAAQYDDDRASDAYYAQDRTGYVYDERAACPHPVDLMVTVFATNGAQPRRACSACWKDFGPLLDAERSSMVAEYPSIAEAATPTDAAIAGRMLVDVLTAHPDLQTDVEAHLIALIKHLDYQSMLLRNRVETISRMEQQEHYNLARVVQERDQAEDDVVDLLGYLADIDHDGPIRNIRDRSEQRAARGFVPLSELARWRD